MLLLLYLNCIQGYRGKTTSQPTRGTGFFESLWEEEVGWSGPGFIVRVRAKYQSSIMSAAHMTLKPQLRLVNSEKCPFTG